MTTDIFDDEVFKCIEPEKLEIIKKLAEKAKDKSVMEIIDIFSQESSALSRGKPLSSQEQDAVAAAMLRQMTPEDRLRFKQMLNLVRTYSK